MKIADYQEFIKACKTKDLNSVNEWLEKGIDCNLTYENDFKSAIQIASQNRDAALLMKLIEKRQPFKAEQLEKWLSECAKSYDNRKTKEAWSENQRLFTYCASRMVHHDVGRLLSSGDFFSSETRYRYAAHIDSVPLGIENPSSSEDKYTELVGWSVGKFIAIRLHAWFELLVKLNQGCDEISYCPPNFPSALKSLFLEILEMAHVYEELTAIESCAGNKDALLTALTRRIAANIQNLPVGKSFCFSIGYPEHALYLQVKACSDAKRLLLIDNLGQGVEKHQKTANKEAYPFAIGEIDKSLFREANEGFAYLKGLFDNFFQTDSSDRAVRAYQKTIYQPAIKQSHDCTAYPSFPIQTISNCVVWNTLPRLKRLDTELPGFYDWLFKHEKNLILDEARAKEAEQLTKHLTKQGLFFSAGSTPKNIELVAKWLNQHQVFNVKWTYQLEEKCIWTIVENTKANKRTILALAAKGALNVKFKTVTGEENKIKIKIYEVSRDLFKQHLKLLPNIIERLNASSTQSSNIHAIMPNR